MLASPSHRRTYSTKSIEFARRASPVRWSRIFRPLEPGTKWTRSPPMSACAAPSRSYSQNDFGAVLIAASTTSRGKRIRPFASWGRPRSISSWRMAGPRISIPISARTRSASSRIRSMSTGPRTVRDGRTRGLSQPAWPVQSSADFDQPAPGADRALQGAQDQPIDQDSNGTDPQHRGQQLGSIEQVTGPLEPDPDRRLTGHDHQQLAGHQAAPGECPALLEAGHEGGQGGGQDDVAVGGDPPGSEDPAGTHQERRHMVDAADQAVGNGRRRAEHDHEQDGRLAQLEEQDRQGKPGDRGHRLQSGDQ